MIEAMRFIGEDGSMGYKHGEIYNLYIYPHWFGYRIVVEPVGKPSMRCPYRNIFTFLQNWQSTTLKERLGE
jgi:hypothetical protein